MKFCYRHMWCYIERCGRPKIPVTDSFLVPCTLNSPVDPAVPSIVITTVVIITATTTTTNFHLPLFYPPPPPHLGTIFQYILTDNHSRFSSAILGVLQGRQGHPPVGQKKLKP